MNKRISLRIFSVLIAFSAIFAVSSANAENAHKPAKDAPSKAKVEKKIGKTKNIRRSPENFDRYAKENLAVKKNPIAVFMGDSITANWASMDKDFFADNNYIGRGISGQVSFQMLARFRPDVIELKPKIVLILAGTNDIAQNHGLISTDNICKNIISMCELAKYNKIVPVICSVLPAHKYVWRPQIEPISMIADLNAKLKAYAHANNIEFLDYYSALIDERKGLTTADSKDGVHPTKICYVNKLDKMAKAKIEEILKNK